MMFRKLGALLLLFNSLIATPSGKNVVHGVVDTSYKDKNLIINQSSQKAIIEWENFSIGLNERVKINQSLPDGAILNKVIGSDPSKILGSLESNGFVYLVNEQGIVIGKEGKIETKGFLASCLNLKNEHFLDGKTLYFQGDKSKDLINLGTIQTFKEDVFLFAQSVKNEGVIKAKGANLIGADAVYLTEDKKIFVSASSNGKVENNGLIQTVQARLEGAGGDIYSQAINQSGIIEANGIERLDGKIVLKAHSNVIDVSGSFIAKSNDQGGTVQITGGDEIRIHDTARINANGDVKGGEILIGGDYQGKNKDIQNTKSVWINKKAKITADAISHGNGGKVIIWGDKQNLFGGTISAKGGELSGDGGFVEVSAKDYLMYRGSVFTNAPNGKIGKLLIDPSDITISLAASSVAFPTAPEEYNPPGVAAATLNNSDLTNAVDGLDNNNVTISTSAGVGGSGIVTFAADVIWSAATMLTVNADQSIIINSGVTLSNTSAASNFTAFDFTATGSTANSIGIDIVGGISTVNGNINLVGDGGVASSNYGIYLRNTSTGLSSTGTGAEAGTITLNGTGGTGASNCYGCFIQGAGDRITSVDGNISVTGLGGGNGTSSGNNGIFVSNGAAISSTGTTSDAATITLHGTTGPGTTNSFGTYITNASSGVSSVNGDIDITGIVASATGNVHYGILLESSGFIESTGTGANAATVTLNGNAGAGASTIRGVRITGTTLITSVDGNIEITGTSSGSSNSCDGIANTSSTISSTGVGANAATITLNGTGGGTAGSGYEMFTNAGTISTEGAISITVNSGPGAGEQGLDMVAGTAFIGNGSTGADITISANTILLQTIQSTGTLIIQPNTLLSTIGLGNSAVGTLSLTATELSNIQNGFTEIIFGRVDGTGAIDVRAFTYLDPVTIRSLSGTITVNGALAAGSNDITLISNSMDIASSVTGTGALTIEPGQTSTTIGLGTGATGTLNLTGTEIGNLTNGFSSITFGRTDQDSAVDMEAVTYNDPIVVYGKQIDVDGAITAGTNDVTLNVGPASAGTFNLDAAVTTSGTFLINGGGFDDAFNINIAGQTATLDGSTGTNTLTGPNAVNTWTITGDNAGTLDSIIFSNIQNLVGNASTDDFTFSGAFQISGGIDGSGGTNTVVGPNLSNAWTISSDDGGSVEPTGSLGATGFSNITNLTGGSSTDVFTFSGAFQISGGIDGSGGTNTVVGPNLSNAWTISSDDGGSVEPTGSLGATGFSNITNLTGGSSTDVFTFSGAFQISGGIDGSGGTNTVVGPNLSNAWTISSDDGGSIEPTGSLGATGFSNITNLTGGSSTDVFTFSGAFQISGGIDGGAGSNTINGPNVNNIWNVTSQTTGTITPFGALGATSYSNVGILVGNASDDTFNLSPDITLPSITAGAGTDTLTFLAGWTIPAIVNLNTIIDFEVINGPPGLDNELIGNNLDNVWTITAANAGTLENTSYPFPTVFTFSNFPDLRGGSQSDTFDFTAGFVVSSVNGSSGTSNLLAPNTVNTWNITANNAGSVAGISFTNISDLTGGSISDTFVFANQQGVSGRVDGGGPANLNTLDYSAFSPPAVVELITQTSGTASNLGNGFINIGNIIGNVATITPQVIEKSVFYFANLQLLFTELYHCRLIPEFFYRQFEKIKYIRESIDKIYFEEKKKEITNEQQIEKLLSFNLKN